jgi:hypothetical protein
MGNLISRIQRELPDTDKDRYDAAYERGRAQARSGRLVGGLALGAIVGAGLMFLFDPNRGAGRRAELASRTTGLRNDLARTAGGRVEDVQNRAKGAAIEAGIAGPNGEKAMHRGNGTPVAGLPVDDDVRGANVPDEGVQEAWEAAEREARRASKSQASG